MRLRTRLALSYTLFFALVLSLISVGIYLVVRRTLFQEVRTELQVSADLLTASFGASQTMPERFFDDPSVLQQILPNEIEGLRSPTLYVQIFAKNGQLIATSDNLRSQQLPLDLPAKQAIATGKTLDQTETVGEVRVLGFIRPLVAQGELVGALHVAQSLHSVDQALEILLFGMTIGNSVALLAAARGGAWLAQRALAPVDEIARIAQSIVNATDLHRRVPVVDTDDELGRLSSTVNDLLERLESLFTAQHRFIAEVSHELRTPLTAMRGNLELLQAGMVDDPELRAESLADMTQEVNRLTRMANDVLLLAQTESGVTLRMQPVVLDDLVLEVYRELISLATHITLHVAVNAQVTVEGDRDRLKQALLNLGANALQHTPAGGEVTIELTSDTAWANVAVRDTGLGIPAELLPHIFDRFYLGPKASLRRADGAGLGLSIVKWIAEAHHGRVEVSSTPAQGSTFNLYIPVRKADAVFAVQSS